MSISPRDPAIVDAVKNGLIDPSTVAPGEVRDQLEAIRGRVAAGATDGPRVSRKPRPAHELIEPFITAAANGATCFGFPIDLESVVNADRINRAAIGRSGRQRRWVGRGLAPHLDALAPFARHALAGTTFRVRLVRLAPGTMDLDNLGPTLKYVRDGLAFVFGVDDRDGRPVDWRYGQTRSAKYGCAVVLTPPGADEPLLFA